MVKQLIFGNFSKRPNDRLGLIHITMKTRLFPLLAALFLAAAQPLRAENDTISPALSGEIGEVQVTASRTAKVASDRLRVITTLSRSDIRALPAQNLQELLDYLPGIDIRTRGANGVQADISMRGGTFDQTIVMLNGVNITETQTGHFNFDIPVDLSAVDRIEVLQGTSMSIFGLSAFAGAINIITGENGSNATEAAISGGDHGLLAARLGTNQNIGPWRLTASASYNGSSGYMHNTDYSYGNLFLQAQYADEKAGHFNLQLGGQLKDYGANSFYSLAYPDQFESTKTLLASLSWDRRIGSFALSASAYARIHQDRYELYRDFIGAPASYTSHNHHITTTAGINFKGAWYSAIGKTSVGIELRDEHILSNVLGSPLASPRHVPFQPDSVLFTKAKNRLNVNYFAEQSFSFGRFSASLGFAGNYNTMFRHNYAYGANLSYAFVPGGNISASFNRALRLPTFLDLYYESPVQIANPDLLPEKSLTAELSLRYCLRGLRASLSAYYRIGHDIIDWVKRPDETQWHSMNHSRVDAMGGELSLAYSYGYWLKDISATYSFCHMDKDAGSYISKYALDYLRHKFVLSLSHGIWRGFGASWTLSYQQRAGSYTDRSGLICTYSPVWLLDGRVYWQGSRCTLYVEASNITDARYYDYGGILQPGIWAKGGIEVSI